MTAERTYYIYMCDKVFFTGNGMWIKGGSSNRFICGSRINTIFYYEQRHCPFFFYLYHSSGSFYLEMVSGRSRSMLKEKWKQMCDVQYRTMFLQWPTFLQNRLTNHSKLDCLSSGCFKSVPEVWISMCGLRTAFKQKKVRLRIGSQ